MYTEFFGFTEKPFTITPNPRFMYLSHGHKEALAHLLYGIQNHSGFVEITGEVGAGKTTVLRTLFEQLAHDAYRLAFIFNPNLSALELLRNINREFGIACTSVRHDELMVTLNEFLLTENAAGHTVVLVIDEAQSLSPEVLEQIRLLSNLETITDKLIQIVLVGQPELGQMLNRTDLRQLSQRITVRYFLGTISLDETCRYIQHRLDVAGGRELVHFQPAALRTVYRLTRGLPRMINVLCDRALLIAYGEGRREIRAADIRLAQSELRRAQAPLLPGRGRTFIAVVLVVVLAVLGGRAVLSLPAPREKVPTVARMTQHSDIDTLRNAFAGQDATRNATAALKGLLSCWKITSEVSSGADPLASLAATASANGLNLLPLSGGIALLEKLNSPALVRLLLPGMTEPRYLTIVRQEGEYFTMIPAVAKRSVVSRDELAALWSGQAWLLWKNWRAIPTLVTPDLNDTGVTRLQEQLSRSEDLSAPITGVYDRATIKAVTDLQARTGLVQDGRVGPQTLVRLYQESGDFAVPMLREVRKQL